VSTDYFPPIQRAVQGLSPNTLETRRALYEKARSALLKQLRAADPALTESQITKERLLLEDAIRRIETDMLRPETAERMLGASRSAAAPALAAPDYADDDEVPMDEADDAPIAAPPSRALPATRRNERRPLAPHRRPVEEGGGKRYLIIGVLAAVLLGGGAGALMLLPGNDVTPPPPATSRSIGGTAVQPPPAEATKPTSSGKNGERLGDPAKPAAAVTPTPEKPAVVATGTTEPPASTQTPATPPPAPNQLVTAQEAPVAQKALLLEEQADQPGQGKFYQGTTTWRTQSVSGGSNAALETAIVGEIEIPERKLKVILTLRRNGDSALPATHTLQIQFAVPADFPNVGVQDIANVLPKTSQQQPGVPLTGGKVKVTNGVFLIGLQDSPQDRNRNLQLLRERGWFDIPILYDNGRRAILTLEKGVPGDKVFEDAFAAWNAAAQAQPQQ